MNESGPIRKTQKDLGEKKTFYDLSSLSPSVWRASYEGKAYVLKAAPDSSSASIALLRREFQIARTLSHPNIVQTFGFEEQTPVGPAIVMEYVEGVSLTSFLSSSPSFFMRKKIFFQILAALEYLHIKNIVHDDIKPENILVSSLGQDVKIIDFGLSDTAGDFLNRRLGGTAGFSAPEVISGVQSMPLSAASDVFSAGKILNFIFPGRYMGVVRKCCHTDPGKRYQNVNALRSAIMWRDLLPVVVSALLVVGAIIWISVAPEVERKNQEQVFQDREVRVIEDMEVLASDIADSLSDRTLVPYQEFAVDVRNTFVVRVAEYRTMLDQDLLPVCDSVYERLFLQLTDLIVDIPSFSILGSQGKISKQEEQRCQQLYFSGKRYIPAEQ